MSKAIAKNSELLYDISTADRPRFIDEENVEENFRKMLAMFFDVVSVLYTIPMNGYYPEDKATEENWKEYHLYQRYRHISYERCIQQAQMRILTLGRASCGFVGAFSSGKTSYLNTEVFGKEMLPVDKNASTSIPTYIFSGRNDKLIFENMRGNIRVSSDFGDLKHLAHSNKPKGCPCQFQWDAVIKRIFCFSSNLKYNRDLVYVDLPGYSASVNDNISMKEAIDGCDKVVYFKPVPSGQLNEKDIAYLHALNAKDVMVVLSKADEKSPADCRKVYDLVKATLEENEIDVGDHIVFYTRRPDVFVSDNDFFKQLKIHREKLEDFILDTSARENDMQLSNAVMEYYANGFIKHEERIFLALGMVENSFDDFLGNRELDHTFFEAWKDINKNIADSSGNYVDTHIFSANTVRIDDYLKANSNRATNYFISDTYDSKYNLSYQEAMYGYTLYDLYKTALYTQICGRAHSNYDEACNKMDRMEKHYSEAKKNIDFIFTTMKYFFDYHKQLSNSIVQDAQVAYKLVGEAYGQLLDYVKNYEKRWQEQ